MKNQFIAFLIVCSMTHCDQNLTQYEEQYKQAYYNNSLSQFYDVLNSCDSKRCQALGEYGLGYYFKDIRPDSSLAHAGKAFILYREIQDKEGIVNSKWLCAHSLSKAGNNVAASQIYKSTLKLATSRKIQKEIELDLAKSLYLIDDFPEAHKLLKGTSSYFENRNNTRYADSHLYLGTMKAHFQHEHQSPDYNDAFQHLFTALKHYENDSYKAQALNHIGWVFLESNNLEKSEYYLDSANSMKPDSVLLSAINYNYARLNEKRANQKETISAYKRVVNLSNELSLESINSYNELALYSYQNRNEYSEFNKLMNEYKNKSIRQKEYTDNVKKLNTFLIFEGILAKEKLDKINTEKNIILLTSFLGQGNCI